MVTVITPETRQKANQFSSQAKHNIQKTNRDLSTLGYQRVLRSTRGISGQLTRKKIETGLKSQRSKLQSQKSYFDKVAKYPTVQEYNRKIRSQYEREMAQIDADISFARKIKDKNIPTSLLSGRVKRMVKDYRRKKALKEKYIDSLKNTKHYYLQISDKLKVQKPKIKKTKTARWWF